MHVISLLVAGMTHPSAPRNGFDSRQLHQNAGQRRKFWPVFFFINIPSTSLGKSHPLASLRRGTRRDGSTYVQVLYRLT
jgi:hypothetical protein